MPGFEPGTFGLEVRRAIRCATQTLIPKVYLTNSKFDFFTFAHKE